MAVGALVSAPEQFVTMLAGAGVISSDDVHAAIVDQHSAIDVIDDMLQPLFGGSGIVVRHEADVVIFHP
jgi:hypothetical protein